MFGELAIPATLLLVLGVALLTIARFLPDRGSPVTAVDAVETMPLPIGEPGDITGPVTAFSREITWPSLVDPDAVSLDEPERRRVLERLGIIGDDAWAAGILAQAFDEEDGELRVTAIEALGQCTGEDVTPVLERAYHSYVVAERYAAVDGASRRGDVPLLERALRDTEGTVALAAAYGLHRAGRHDLIDEALASRSDARANEIRNVLPILTGA